MFRNYGRDETVRWPNPDIAAPSRNKLFLIILQLTRLLALTTGSPTSAPWQEDQISCVLPRSGFRWHKPDHPA